PVMTLESLEAGSLKIWLRNALKSTEDEAIKQLEWKKIVGTFLVQAKYVTVEWLENDAPQKSLVDLSSRLQKLAATTDVRYLPDYSRPKIPDLIDALSEFQKAKDALEPRDSAKFISEVGDVDFNFTLHWGPEELAELAVKQTLVQPAMRLILAVKKP